jgi:serine/threonine protein kinase
VAIKFIKKEGKKEEAEPASPGSPSSTQSPSRSPSRNTSVNGSGVNISVPPATLIDPAILVSNLTKEVRLLMRLDHPNVIKMFQVFDADAELCIVMEHAKGELIDYIAATGSLSEREARKYFRQVS